MATMALRDAFPFFRFDSDKLHKLQEEIPTALQFLRLRLRFGLPVRVQIGQKFRLVVDLVDEVGQQPVVERNLSGIDVSLATSSSSVDTKPVNRKDQGQVVLKLQEKFPSDSTRQQQTKWIFWASLHNSDHRFSNDVQITLVIQMKQTEATSPNRNLQTFCVNSTWLSPNVLVLPLQVELQVGGSEIICMSTSCQRLFRTADNELVVIEENYGDAMGSHVWDASILFSFAVVQAGIQPFHPSEQDEKKSETKKKHVMLELGSGCGLLAAVLIKHFQSSEDQVTIILTEKSDCTERLQANIDRNGAASSTLVLPLEWGVVLPSSLRHAGVRIVFAADVLYNWVAHEAFLGTLETLIQDDEASTDLHVFLAHKRRGKAAAARLDALVSGTFKPATDCSITINSSSCRWTQWHVEKLASLGHVDLFRLTQSLKTE